VEGPEERAEVKDGKVEVSLPGGELGRRRLFIAPVTERSAGEKPTAAEMERRGAYEPVLMRGESLVDQIRIPGIIIDRSSRTIVQRNLVHANGAQVAAFCKQIGGRLPTEWEWEYAARAGGNTARYGKLDDIAWYYDNSKFATHPVKQKAPNAFGLYDMHGNVWEWCGDWLGGYRLETIKDPKGAHGGVGRVCRGGSWLTSAEDCRVTRRNWYPLGYRHSNLGCRVCFSLG
jgi:formylglycine-generating enzyme required for sulfatase activity